MAFEEWGAEKSGARVAEKDQLFERAANLEAMESVGKIALQPLQLKKYQMDVEKLGLELDGERKMAALLSAQAQGGRVAGGKSFSMGDQLDSLAQTAMQAGLVTKASGLAKDAALIKSREATQLDKVTSRKLSELKMVRETAGLMGQMFGGVKDEAGWEQANALFTFQTGQPSPYADLPYDPSLVSKINSNALTAAERASAEEKRLTREATSAYRTSRLGQIDTQNELRRRRLELEKQAEERRAKAGATPKGGVTSANKAEIEQAETLLRKDFPGIEGVDLEEAAFSVASEARAIRKKNPAIDAAGAIQQALQVAREAGDFTETSVGSIMGKEIGKKVKYSGKGRTAALPAPVPSNPKEAKVGRYYISPSGVVGKWNGKKFEITRSLSADNSRSIDEENEEEDDE